MSLDLEDRHAAWLAGVDYGMAQRIEADIEDQVLARLHAQALEALGMARRLARVKGPAWAAMVAECGDRE